MVTTEEEPIIMGGGALSQEEVDSMMEAIEYQKMALDQCALDFLYYIQHHVTEHMDWWLRMTPGLPDPKPVTHHTRRRVKWSKRKQQVVAYLRWRWMQAGGA